jgi:hypothetical protein
MVIGLLMAEITIYIIINLENKMVSSLAVPNHIFRMQSISAMMGIAMQISK